MKAITSGFKTGTLTVFTVKFHITNRWFRINLSVQSYSYLKIYLYDSSKLGCSGKNYYKFSLKDIYISVKLDWFQIFFYLKIPATFHVYIFETTFEMEISYKSKTIQDVTSLFLLFPMCTPVSPWPNNVTLKCNSDCFRNVILIALKKSTTKINCADFFLLYSVFSLLINLMYI